MQYSFWQPSYSNELYHYGVLGMKWGVHKVRSAARALDKADKQDTLASLAVQTGKIDKNTAANALAITTKNLNSAHDRYIDAQKSLAMKSQRKLERYNQRYEKKQAKADLKYEKAERKASSILVSKRSADKAFRKASKAQFKANKAAAKGKKWYEQMEKSYKKAGLSMSKESQEIGKELIRQVRANSRAMYAASYAAGR